MQQSGKHSEDNYRKASNDHRLVSGHPFTGPIGGCAVAIRGVTARVVGACTCGRASNRKLPAGRRRRQGERASGAGGCPYRLAGCLRVRPRNGSARIGSRRKHCIRQSNLVRRAGVGIRSYLYQFGRLVYRAAEFSTGRELAGAIPATYAARRRAENIRS